MPDWKHLAWFAERADAIEFRNAQAKTLVRLGFANTYGVRLKPQNGGYAVVLEKH